MVKHLLVFGGVFASIALQGRSFEENYDYVKQAMDMAENSWVDCLKEDDTNEVEMLFQTMDGLFAYEMPSNSCGHGWSAKEKQCAFDDFLFAFGCTNLALVSDDCLRTGTRAFMLSLDLNYTNSLAGAKQILEGGNSFCRGVALSVVLRFGTPTVDGNAAIIAGITNRAEMSFYDRCEAMDKYGEQIMKLSGDDGQILTNIVCSLYRARSGIDNVIALDKLLLRSFPDYVLSSNRLELACAALASNYPGETFGKWGETLRQYFDPVTNQLVRCNLVCSEVAGRQSALSPR